ncbi:lasso peptide biosynthesis B2 protein [Nonomuraea sp. NPDC046570]|uniref:lasso peptide biosynthesis B2 protein n=1 Tax=Nonomuraea sp. NPDC046570 TaxID=3155255 RepID=UPI00340BE083
MKIRIPAQVHYEEQEHGGLVVMDRRTGLIHGFSATARLMWREWEAGGGLEEAVGEVAARHPEVAHDRIRADAERFLHDLLRRGLVEPGTGLDETVSKSAGRPLEGEASGMAGRAALKNAAAGWALQSAAFVVLVVALALVRLPFRVPYAVVTALHGRWCAAEPDEAEARRIVAAAETAARWWPGRAACLEESLAAVLLAACVRRRLTWCLGARTDPYRFHAWVETGGRPVVPPGAPGFQRILSA